MSLMSSPFVAGKKLMRMEFGRSRSKIENLVDNRSTTFASSGGMGSGSESLDPVYKYGSPNDVTS